MRMKGTYENLADRLRERTDNARSLLRIATTAGSRECCCGDTGNVCRMLCDYIGDTAEMAARVLRRARKPQRAQESGEDGHTAAEWEEAEEMCREHRRCFEDWQEGLPVDVWRDDGGRLCIRYESGKWWHYRKREDGSVEWW